MGRKREIKAIWPESKQVPKDICFSKNTPLVLHGNLNSQRTRNRKMILPSLMIMAATQTSGCVIRSD